MLKPMRMDWKCDKCWDNVGMWFYICHRCYLKEEKRDCQSRINAINKELVLIGERKYWKKVTSHQLKTMKELRETGLSYTDISRTMWFSRQVVHYNLNIGKPKKKKIKTRSDLPSNNTKDDRPTTHR